MLVNYFLLKNEDILDINFFRNKQWDKNQKNFKTALKKYR